MVSGAELYKIHSYLDKHEIIWIASLLSKNKLDNVTVKIGACKCGQVINCYGATKGTLDTEKWFMLTDTMIVDDWLEQFKTVVENNKELKRIFYKKYKTLRRYINNETA